VLERHLSDLLTGDLMMNTAWTVYRAIAGFAIAPSRERCSAWRFARPARALVLRPDHLGRFPMPKIAFLPVVIPLARRLRRLQISMGVLDAIFPVVTAT